MVHAFGSVCFFLWQRERTRTGLPRNEAPRFTRTPQAELPDTTTRNLVHRRRTKAENSCRAGGKQTQPRLQGCRECPTQHANKAPRARTRTLQGSSVLRKSRMRRSSASVVGKRMLRLGLRGRAAPPISPFTGFTSTPPSTMPYVDGSPMPGMSPSSLEGGERRRTWCACVLALTAVDRVKGGGGC